MQRRPVVCVYKLGSLLCRYTRIVAQFLTYVPSSVLDMVSSSAAIPVFLALPMHLQTTHDYIILDRHVVPGYCPKACVEYLILLQPKEALARPHP